MGKKGKFRPTYPVALESGSTVHKSSDKNNPPEDSTSKQHLKDDSYQHKSTSDGHGHSSKSKDSRNVQSSESAFSNPKTMEPNPRSEENSNFSRKSSSNSAASQSRGALSKQSSQYEKSSSKMKQPKSGSVHPNVNTENKPVFQFIDGDLFDANESFSLAHCVGEDLAMGAGIAVEFRKRFRHIGPLLEQHVRTGGVAVLEMPTRFVYNLVTKRVSTGKPTMASLMSSLREMKLHIVEHNVRELAIPEIGSGLDNLDWDLVLEALEKIFCDVAIHIQVYHYKPDNSGQSTYPNKLVDKSMDLVTITNNTALLYIGSVGDNLSESMISLDKKHNFIENYKSNERTLGDVIRHERENSDVTYGFICVDIDGKFSYSNFDLCLNNFLKMNIRDKYDYAGISTVRSPNDVSMMLKIENMMKYNVKYQIEFWLCNPVSFPQDCYELSNYQEREKIIPRPQRSFPYQRLKSPQSRNFKQ